MKITDFKKGEGVCIGDYKNTKIEMITDTYDLNNNNGEFICLNPIDPFQDFGYKDKEYYQEFTPRRADINVSEYRNFLFEMDSVSLEDQLKIFESSNLAFKSITYSGGKSYHAVISVLNGLDVEVNTKAGIDEYKAIWKRLQSYIDKCGLEAGFELPKGKTSFIDSSCQNPSRLTRLGGVLRKSTGKLQEIVYIGNLYNRDDFYEIVSKCPEIKKIDYCRESFNNVESKADFWKLCPLGLKNKLKYVDWAGSEGMYPVILKLTYWAIDSTGVDKDTFLEILWDRTFIKLIEAGYPEEKLTVAVDHAYNEKRRA